MKHVHLLVVAALVAAAVFVAQAAAAPAGAALVTNANDAGPGSFRAAVAQANASGEVGQIVFAGGLAPVALASTVVYTGDQSLRIHGNGAVLDGDGFRAETAGDLSVSGLTVRDAPGEGLAYVVPSDASGVVRVSLSDVSAIRNAGHGVLLDEQEGASAASLDVSVVNSTFADNGFSVSDRDGLRAQEGGDGDLVIMLRNVASTGNAADGIELDERGAGDVAFTVSGTAITGNGSFDPEDLDDGMDVDESGDGALRGVVTGSTASDNLEEGWDFNENDAGDFVVDMTNVHASRNGEEGVDFEEDDDDAGGGDLVTTLVGVTADDNAGGDAGIKIREKGAGSLAATVRGAQANGNDEDGINVREDGVGDLEASVAQSTTAGNGDDGVNFDENADGDLTAATSHGTSSENADDGVVADAGSPGAGTLDVFFMTFAGNGGSDVAVVGDVTLTRKP